MVTPPLLCSGQDLKYGFRVCNNEVAQACGGCRQSQSFDLAEDLEQGIAPGLLSSFVEPAPESEDQRFTVQRALSKTGFSLVNENGNTVLHAKCCANGARFDIYTASRGDQISLAHGPAFILQSRGSARNLWSLISTRCDRCEFRGRRQCGKREIMQLVQSVEQIGKGQAFCMDIDLPSVCEDGSRAVMCDVCRDPQSDWSMELTTKLPKWNPKHKSLTLDFGGRVSMASAKNFLLQDPKDSSITKLLYGKVAEDRFVLDFSYPLGPVQAFAAALATNHWT